MSKSKYEPLMKYLSSQRNKSPIKLSFREIEEIIGAKLPPSAYTRRTWWANNPTRHTQASNGWLAAGYMVSSVDLERKIVVFVKQDIDRNNEPSNSTEPPRSYALSNTANSARKFEEFARKIMSEYFGTELKERRKPGWPKKFDLVSPDYRIVGDAKYYTMVRGKHPPPAKFATITEHVFMLENIDADIRFLVFGNDKRVPLEWLKRYKFMVKTVKFYFIDDEGNVEELL